MKDRLASPLSYIIMSRQKVVTIKVDQVCSASIEFKLHFRRNAKPNFFGSFQGCPVNRVFFAKGGLSLISSKAQPPFRKMPSVNC